MKLAELKERLQILLEGNTINEKSEQISIKIFEQLLAKLKRNDMKQAEMLFTHLPVALTRIEKGETVEGPGSEIMNEIEQSEHFLLAKDLVTYTEKLWGKELPEEEKHYLYMHLITIINKNLGGNE